jgi:hypothetical protein
VLARLSGGIGFPLSFERWRTCFIRLRSSHPAIVLLASPRLCLKSLASIRHARESGHPGVVRRSGFPLSRLSEKSETRLRRAQPERFGV